MQLGMGIAKIEVKIPEKIGALQEFKTNRISALESLAAEVKSAVTHSINQILNAEMTVFLGKFEQSENKRNGFREREYSIKGLGCIRLRFAKDRNGEFKSEILPSQNIVCAFTALRMEYEWNRLTVDAKSLGNLSNTRYNKIESALEELMH